MITFEWTDEESLLLEGLGRLLSPLRADADRDRHSYWCPADSEADELGVGNRWYDREGNNWFLHRPRMSKGIYTLSHRFVSDSDRMKAVGWFLDHIMGARNVEVA